MAAGRQGRDGVAMAHPHLRARLKATEQRVGSVDSGQMGTAILAAVGVLDATTAGVGDVLRAIANAQHRHTAHKLREVDLEGFRVVHREG